MLRTCLVRSRMRNKPAASVRPSAHPSPMMTWYSLAVRAVCNSENSVTTALKHPLLKEGGLLAPLVASLAQWHLVDDPEEGLGSNLTEALKATLREADGLKRALGQVSIAFFFFFFACGVTVPATGQRLLFDRLLKLSFGTLPLLCVFCAVDVRYIGVSAIQP